MTASVPMQTIYTGFIRLNLMLLPLTLLLLVFIGIMAGGAPKQEGDSTVFQGFVMVAATLYLMPAALVAWHVAFAWGFDAACRIKVSAKGEVSWHGLVVAGVIAVVAGNFFVDDLYQFRRGDYTLSVMALVFDLGGMAALVKAGGGRLPLLDRK